MAHILLLHGASSSGKTTLGEVLRCRLRDPEHVLLSIDAFMGMLPDRAYRDPDRFASCFAEFVAAYHGCLVSFASRGIPVIADHVLAETAWREDFARQTRGVRVHRIKLYCPVDILEAREDARGDRRPGLARSQAEAIHAGLRYDLELDTSVLGPDACARRIAETFGLPAVDAATSGCRRGRPTRTTRPRRP